MKKQLIGIFLLAVMVAFTGCKSFGPTPEQTAGSVDAYKAFVGQQMSYDSIHIVGSAEHPATISGIEITISSALPARSALGNDDTRARAFETLGSVARMAIGAAAAMYGFNQIADMNTTAGQVNNAPAPVTP